MTTPLPRSVADRLGPARSARLGRPGYLLLPLRLFLGITFCYAGLQKLSNPAYLDPHSSTSVAAQMQALKNQSPIGPLLSLSAHAPTLVGLLIALGELAVGIGALLGLLTRVAALGGALLALTFFLTVSWTTTPYYYGSDIVFLFAWTVLIAFGAGGALSLDSWLHNRARASAGLAPEPRLLAVPATRLRELCGRESKCGLATSSGQCERQHGCPVFAPPERLSGGQRAELSRRSVLATGAGVAGAGLLTALLAGVTAAIGRAVHGNGGTPAAVRGPAGTSTAPSPTRTSPTPAHTHARRSRRRHSAGGTPIAQVSAVPTGQAKPFQDPKTQSPAWLVHEPGGSFVAFSAVCTHAGCGVSFDPSSMQFICPCHGGTYDARTGKVLAGPPPAPLAPIPVQVRNGEVTTP